MHHIGAAPAPSHTIGRHGEVRGLRIDRGTKFEGRFGRMFSKLTPATFTQPALTELAKHMSAPPDTPTPEDKRDDEENSGISAGYTYLGQFIDHDLTFDPISSLERQNDVDALTDFRTPRFDLDSVYGRGPADQPYLYRGDQVRMVLGERLVGNEDDPNARMVPRLASPTEERARAVIGDPRNDENVIVSQLHASMLRFHNRMADELGSNHFEEIQKEVRWHYQWVVLTDFLPTIIGRELADEILKPEKHGRFHPELKFFSPKPNREFMPIEFSVGAYRFGHSMVRPIYRLNQFVDRLPIFALHTQSLVGFDKFPFNWAIDWRLFFKSGPAPAEGRKRVQPAYKPDTSLVNPLAHLPAAVAQKPASLPLRNLERGWRLGLPSGQAVAAAMGEEVIDDKNLRVGKATEEAAEKKENPKLVDLSAEFKGNAPLWYYVLAEAQQQFVNDETPIHLGRVGGRIVGEVIVGLMVADSSSVLHAAKPFVPRWNGVDFKMADLLAQARRA